MIQIRPSLTEKEKKLQRPKADVQKEWTINLIYKITSLSGGNHFSVDVTCYKFLCVNGFFSFGTRPLRVGSACVRFAGRMLNWVLEGWSRT